MSTTLVKAKPADASQLINRITNLRGWFSYMINSVWCEDVELLLPARPVWCQLHRVSGIWAYQAFIGSDQMLGHSKPLIGLQFICHNSRYHMKWALGADLASVQISFYLWHKKPSRIKMMMMMVSEIGYSACKSPFTTRFPAIEAKNPDSNSDSFSTSSPKWGKVLF